MWNARVYELDEKEGKDNKYFDKEDLNMRRLLSKPLLIEKGFTTFIVILGSILFKLGIEKDNNIMRNIAWLLFIYIIIQICISSFRCLSISTKVYLTNHNESSESKKLIYKKEISKKWFNLFVNSINAISIYLYAMGVEQAFYILFVGLVLAIIRKLVSIGIIKARLAMVSAELEGMLEEIDIDNYETYDLWGKFSLRDEESREMEIMYGIGNMCMVYEFKELLNKVKLLSIEEKENHQSKIDLITNLSHDLKTPLTSIYNSVYILKTEELTNDERYEQVEIIDKKLGRLKKLTNNLNEVIDSNYSTISVEKSNHGLLSLLQSTIDNHRLDIDKKGLDIRINNIENSRANIDIDKTKRIFDNVISNIIKYSLEDSRVYINLSKNEEENQISIEFKNISKYENNVKKELIGNRFVQGDKSRNIEGHGLGLNIIKNLMRVQGGDVDISIQGDLFKIVLTFEVY